MPLLSVKDLEFSYPFVLGRNAADAQACNADDGHSPHRSLKGISFNIEASSVNLVCGKNASGKSSLLRMLKPSLAPKGDLSGEIFFEGAPIWDMDLRDEASDIGFLFQDPQAQICTGNVLAELAFGMENLGFAQNEMHSRIAEVSNYLGIGPWIDCDIDRLSGGQKQILNLASILVLYPKLLILDEPISQLDPLTADRFLELLFRLNSDLGITVILSSHRVEGIFARCDQVLVLDEGSLAACGDPETAALSMSGAPETSELLPCPAQVYAGFDRAMRPRGALDGGPYAFNDRIPLSVSEGRRYVESYPGRANQKDLPMAAKGLTGNMGADDPGACIERAEGQNAIDLEDVWFRYGRHSDDILKGVTIGFERSRITAIVGSNASGKTTLLKTILGICKPYRGKVRTGGSFGYIPQDPSVLFAGQSVEEELEAALDGWADRDAISVGGLAEKFNLCDCLLSHPFDLSQGQRSLLAFAIVYARDPGILVLDEPTQALDAYESKRLGEVLCSLAEDEGVSVLLASHDLDFCAEYADNLAVMFDGEAVAFDPARSFFTGNRFYTTCARRMSYGLIEDAVTKDEVIGYLESIG